MITVAVSVIVAIATILISTFSMQETVNATTDTSEYKKALATVLSVCMDSNAFKDEITAKSFTGTWTGGINAIVGSNAKKAYPAGYDGATIKKGCQDIFKEALSIGGVSLAVSSGDLAGLMAKIGYENVGTSSKGKCMQLTYYIDSVESDANYFQDTKAVCIEDIDGDGDGGVIQSAKPTIVANGGSSMVVAFKAGTGKVNIDCNVGMPGEGGCGDVTYTVGSTTWGEFKTAVWNKIKNSSQGVAGLATDGFGSYGFRYALDLGKGINVTDYGDVTAKYVKKSDAATIISKNLLGITNYGFEKYETMALYQTALVDYYKVSAIDPSKLSQDELDVRLGDNNVADGYSETKVISNGLVVSCLVKPTQMSTSSIPAVGANNVFGGFARFNGAWGDVDAETINFKGITEWMRDNGAGTAAFGQLRAPNIDCSEEHYTPTNPNPTQPGGSGSTDNNDDDGTYICFEAAESIGWVLCPVLDALGKAVNGIYGWVESSFLIVDSDMMGDATHEAWTSFRNFANVIFIIVFLVVILSQITGFGISNYGVKKILPRLIAIAILVNVSFILCQLAVDISNIVGSDIQNILSDLAKVKSDGEISAGGIVTEILSILGLGAGIKTAIALAPLAKGVIMTALATPQNAALWLIMILISFIGFLAGIFFAGTCRPS